MTDNHDTENSKKDRKIRFFIDAEEFKTEKRQLTVREILVWFAKEDPELTTLALKTGGEYTKFTDLSEKIKMKNGMKFFVLHNSPTPVSFIKR